MSCVSGGDGSGGRTGSGKAEDATADMPAGGVSELGEIDGGIWEFGLCRVLRGVAAVAVL